MKQDIQKKLLYQLDRLPIFQNRLFTTEAEAKGCRTGDMRLVEDQRTGLVYNAAFCPDLMQYDAHYQNEQAVSPFFKQHLNAVLHILDRCLGKESLVEIGCGKGFFLEMLVEKGFNITGFDPAYEGHNPRIKNQYFNPGVGIKAKGLILRHVLEHLENPFQFLLQLKEANGGGGIIYIEVPCFDWICQHRAWFDIFYEHANYFRMTDFERMFVTVIEGGKLFGGQYLYIVAELSSLRQPKIDTSDRVIFPAKFTQNLFRHERRDNQKTAIWGGASKGVVFALLKERTGQPVSTVIDINPAKQGRYLPVTGLLVQSPAEGMAVLPQGSIVYVMNSNYLAEIKDISNNVYNYVEIDHE